MIKEIVKKQPIPIKVKEEISHDHFHHHYKHTHPEEVTKVVKGNKGWLSESTEGGFGSTRFGNGNGNGFGGSSFGGGSGFGGGSNGFGGNNGGFASSGFASSTSYSSTNFGTSGSQGGSFEYNNFRGGRKVRVTIVSTMLSKIFIFHLFFSGCNCFTGRNAQWRRILISFHCFFSLLFLRV